MKRRLVLLACGVVLLAVGVAAGNPITIVCAAGTITSALILIATYRRPQ